MSRRGGRIPSFGRDGARRQTQLQDRPSATERVDARSVLKTCKLASARLPDMKVQKPDLNPAENGADCGAVEEALVTASASGDRRREARPGRWRHAG